MKESVVLLMDLTPTCTELARHLVLSGINLCILKTNACTESITQDDTQSDFLFSPQDIGEPRHEVVKAKLALMNPFVNIEFSDTLAQDPKVSIIISAVSCLKQAVELN